MKKMIFMIAGSFFAMLAFAQQKEGKVIYERNMQMQIRINDNAEMDHAIPRTRKDKFELTFGNNQSLWKHGEEEIDNNEGGGGGMQIRMMGPGMDDVVFYDFTAARRVDQRELFDKKFIIEDTIAKLSWKLTDETKTILGHVCRQAITSRVGRRMQMNMDNGKMERKEVTDTTPIVAWFTTDIPVSAGPEVQGQLPGLILELDLAKGRSTYKALEISPKADLSSIKAPTKGKKVTSAEFRAETAKMMEEMQKNNQGGNTRIIMR